MKKIYFSVLGLVMLAGCNQQVDAQTSKEEHVQHPVRGKRLTIERVVVFKKGLSLEDAKQRIFSKGMEISTVYKVLSQSSGEPMLLVRSPYAAKKTDVLLKADPRIKSVSANQTTHLEPDPSKPQ